MAAPNSYISTGERVKIPSCAAARTGGLAYVENGWAGVAGTSTTAATQPYALMTEGEFDIAFIASSVQGDLVAIHDTTFALTRVAQGPTAAAPSGARILGKVTAIPGTPGTHGTAPKTGRMWIKLQPQSNPTA